MVQRLRINTSGPSLTSRPLGQSGTIFRWYPLLVSRLKNFVSSILLALGYSINSKSKQRLLSDLIHLADGDGMSPVEARKIYKSSKSQLGQDLLALIASGAKKPGFFVEFGAADGVALSNSYLLEKEFGWSGILCEPSRSWHYDLKRKRSFVVESVFVYLITV